MHFISTGQSFPLSYYIGIKSASLIGDVKLWYTTLPISKYFFRIVDKVESQQIIKPQFKILDDKSIHFRNVCVFDYLAWKILSHYGGSIMGLDSITIAPFQHLIGDSEIMAGHDSQKNIESIAMHGATVVRDSKIALDIFNEICRNLRGTRNINSKFNAFDSNGLKFGGSGIIPFKNNILDKKNIDKVKLLPFGILGGYINDGNPFYLYQQTSTMPIPNARTIPFYSTSTDMSKNITEESIDGTLIGNLVKKLNII